MRYEQWSTPVDLPGVPNARCVSEHLYRGGQPTREGFASLKRLGVKTIINLRGNDSNRDRFDDGAFVYHRIPMNGFNPESDQVVEFLRLASDPAAWPVFVHCQHGADRTGVLVAMHRVIIEGWTTEQAVAEMTRAGMRFHPIYGNLADFVASADIDAIRLSLAGGRAAARD